MPSVDGSELSTCRGQRRGSTVRSVQRLVAFLFTIFMLAHGLVPTLPVYVCTDGGRSLDPCSPPEKQGLAQSQPEWHVGDCCKLTDPATVDAQPPQVANPQSRDRIVVALLAVSPPLMSVAEPAPLQLRRLTRGDPFRRGPPPSLRTILRI